MKRISIIALLIVAGVAGAWAFWAQKAADDQTYRYRLTVTVEADGRLYRASSVIGVLVAPALFPGSAGSRGSVRVTGNAVVVGVPNREPVIVLLRSRGLSDWAAGIAEQTFHSRMPNPSAGTFEAENISAMARLNAAADLATSDYPMVVAFRDRAIPTTIYELSPNDLSPALGAASRIASITIEMTRDPITAGNLDMVLPWMERLTTQLDGDRFHELGKSLANDLSKRDFSRRGL